MTLQVGRAEGTFKIAAISNKYKDTFDDLMDSSDTEFLEVLRSKSAPISARPDLEGDHLDNDWRGQKAKKDCRGGKKRRVVRKDIHPEASVYYQ